MRGGVSDVLDQAQRSGGPRIFTPRRLSLWIIAVVGLAVVVLSGKLFETNDAGFYAVRQAAGTGTLTAYARPGMFFQGFGEVEKYKAADTLHFEDGELGSIEVRFNDGAKAKVAVNVRYELPINDEQLIQIHQKFRSYDALVNETIRNVVSESILLTAAMMSTEESYTTKRAEFSQVAEDQVLNGIYLTEAETVETKDPKTGEILRRQAVTIQKDKDGKPERKHAVLDQYGIRITQFMVKNIDYDEKVDAMIASKQEAMQKTVSARANAEKAQQDRLTAEEEGKKNVAIAKYEQEVQKQKAVTEAEQRLEVAKLSRLAAEQEKAKLIAEGEGEASKRRALMVADGALDKKLTAYVETQKAWAEAFSKSANPVVPGVVVGSQSGSGNAATLMMEMMGVKAARDLAVDLKGKE